MEAGDPLDPELLADVEAYYSGDASDETVARLRARLAADPQLAAAVAAWEAVYRQGVRRSSETERTRAELRATFNTIAAQAPPLPVRSPVRSMFTWLAVAAAVLALVIAGWWVFRAAPVDAAPPLAEEYFAWLPRQEALLGPAEDAAAGLLAYDRQEYATAYPLLTRGVAAGSLDSVNLLYAGVAALGAGRSEEAREVLTTLLETDRYPVEEGELRYYLALAELRLGDRAAARRQLRQLIGDSSRIAVRARELLARIPEN